MNKDMEEAKPPLCRCHHEIGNHEDAGKGMCLTCPCERYEADPGERDEKTGP